MSDCWGNSHLGGHPPSRQGVMRMLPKFIGRCAEIDVERRIGLLDEQLLGRLKEAQVDCAVPGIDI